MHTHRITWTNTRTPLPPYLPPPLASLRPPLPAYVPVPPPPVCPLARLRTVHLRKAPPTPQQLHPLVAAHFDTLRIGTLLKPRLMPFAIFLIDFAKHLEAHTEQTSKP